MSDNKIQTKMNQLKVVWDVCFTAKADGTIKKTNTKLIEDSSLKINPSRVLQNNMKELARRILQQEIELIEVTELWSKAKILRNY